MGTGPRAPKTGTACGYLVTGPYVLRLMPPGEECGLLSQPAHRLITLAASLELTRLHGDPIAKLLCRTDGLVA